VADLATPARARHSTARFVPDRRARLSPSADDEQTEVQRAVGDMFGRGSLYLAMWSLQLVAASAATPIVTRLLGVNDFGKIATAFAVAQVLAALGGFGLHIGVQRQFADEDHAHRARGLITVALVLAGAVGAITYATGPLWSRALGLGSFTTVLQLTVVWAAMTAVCQTMLALLRSQDRLGAFTAVSVAQSFVAQAIGIALLAGAHHTAGAYLLGLLAGQTIALVIAVALVGPRLAGLVDTSTARLAFALSLPLVPHALSIWALNVGDRLVVQRDLGASAVGRYQLSYTIGSLGIIVLSMLHQAWEPRIFAISDDETRRKVLTTARDQLWRMLIPILLLLVVTGPLTLRVWAPSSVRPDRLQLVLVLVALSTLPYAAYMSESRILITAGRTRSLMWITPTCAVLNYGLNLAMVPYLGIEGSALATIISYGALALGAHLAAGGVLRLEPTRPFDRARLLLASLVAVLLLTLPTTPTFLLVRFVAGLGCLCWLVSVGRRVVAGVPIRPSRRRRRRARQRAQPVTTPGGRGADVTPTAQRPRHDDVATRPGPRAVRVATAAVTVYLLVQGLVAGLAGWTTARALSLVPCAVYGVGAGFAQLIRRVDDLTFVALSIGISLSVLLLGGFALVELHLMSRSVQLFTVLGTFAAVLHLGAIRSFVEARRAG
jgi:O-antigen/teichoic acid export membrane protein